MNAAADRILDEFLAASARAGDRASVATLAARWEQRLLRHAWRLLGDRELAREVAQSAWVDIVRGIRRLDDSAAFPAFAYRIVSRRAADAIRSRRRRRRTEAAFADEPRESSTPADELEYSASGKRVASALAALPAEQRAAVALFYLEDLSIAEIAAALDVPPGTVKTRLKSARDRLKVALGATEDADHDQA